MAIWYNMDAPERVTLLPIKGDIVDIARDDGKTEVVVQEGQHQLSYELDEGLIEFGTAVDDGDYDRAVVFLVIVCLLILLSIILLIIQWHSHFLKQFYLSTSFCLLLLTKNKII